MATTCHRWQNNYGGLNAEYSKKLKQLKKQNLRMNALADSTTLGPIENSEKLRCEIGLFQRRCWHTNIH